MRWPADADPPADGHTNDPEDQMATDLELLRDLCAAPAPTGFEAPVQDVVRTRLATVA